MHTNYQKYKPVLAIIPIIPYMKYKHDGLFIRKEFVLEESDGVNVITDIICELNYSCN